MDTLKTGNNLERSIQGKIDRTKCIQRITNRLVTLQDFGNHYNKSLENVVRMPITGPTTGF